MEFAPLDFFPTFTPSPIDYEEIEPELDLAKNDLDDSRSTLQEEESVSSNDTSSNDSKKSVKSTSSENHNMVKQLVITIKQMAGKYIKEIGCSVNSRDIILEVWRIF